MTVELSGKTAIVTGASRGIGRAIAIGLSTRGANVVVGYHRNVDLAAAVVEEIEAAGGKAVAVGGNLAEEQVVGHMFDEAERHFGGIDVVVANAADVVIKPFVELTEDDYDRLFAANVKSAFLTLREAARRVRDDGRIIATSTGGTRMFFTETGLYLGTKGAVEQFVRVLSRELGPRNITVNAISPGFTDTDLLPDRDREVAAGMSPFGRVGQPEDVADVVAFLAGPGSRWVTGQNVAAGGGVA